MAMTSRFKMGGSTHRKSELKGESARDFVLTISSKGNPHIRARKGPVRLLEIENVVRIMEALAKGTLLPPIGLGSDGTLVYGAHRLTAAQLLATRAEKRMAVLTANTLDKPPTKAQLQRIESLAVPHNVELRADSVTDPEAELLENVHRRERTPELAREQLDVLISLGYGTGAGPAKKGDKEKAMPRLAAIWGITPRALREQLAKLKVPTENQSPPKKTASKQNLAVKSRKKLSTALVGFVKEHKGVRTKESKQILSLVSQLTELLGVTEKKMKG